MPTARANMPTARQQRLASLTLLIWSLAVWGWVAPNELVYWDDEPLIFDNPHLKAGSWPDCWRWAWTTFYESNYHPLTWLSLAFDVRCVGGNPTWIHLHAAALHTLSVLLVQRVWQRLTGCFAQSCLLALAFGIHPLRVESVAWASERKDVLSVLFGLLALRSYLQHRQQPRAWTKLTQTGWLTLSLLSKQTLVTFPCVLLLLDAYFDQREPTSTTVSTGRRWLGRVAQKLDLILLCVVFAVVVYSAQSASGAVVSTNFQPLEQRLLNMIAAYGAYLRQAVWPTPLVALYPFQHLTLREPAVWGSGLACLSVVWIGVWQWRRRPAVLIGVLWFAGTLVPMIGLVQVGRQAHADRYTYWPSLGLMWALVSLLSTPTGELRGGRWGRLLAGAALVGWSVMTVRQIAVWRTTVTLATHAVQHTFNNEVMLNGLGAAYIRLGQPELARQYVEQALQIRPDDPRSLYNRALLAVMEGTDDGRRRAIEAFQASLQFDPAQIQARLRLGVMLARDQQHAKAVEHLLIVVKLDPNLDIAWKQLGYSYEFLQQPEQALSALQQAQQLNPGDAALQLRTQMLQQRLRNDRP